MSERGEKGEKKKRAERVEKEDSDDENYDEGLKRFIRNILKNGPVSGSGSKEENDEGDKKRRIAMYLASKEEVKKLTNKEDMKIWKAAFTHKSLDSNPYRNYEIYEYQGDRVLKTALSSYMFNYLKNNESKISESILSSLESYWQSGEPYAKFSLDYRFRDYIRRSDTRSNKGNKGGKGGKSDEAAAEDVFEAFFGALFTIASKNLTMGRAYELSSAIFQDIMDQQTIIVDEEKLKSKVSTLKELFQSYYGIDTIDFVKRESKEAGTIRINYLDFNNTLLPPAEEKNETLAKEKAAQVALIELDKRGINFETGQAKKEERGMRIKNLLDQANTRLSRSDIKYNPLNESSLIVESSRGGSEYVVGLYAAEEDSEKLTQISDGMGTSWQLASIKALNNFIEGKNETIFKDPFISRENTKKDAKTKEIEYEDEESEELYPISVSRNYQREWRGGMGRDRGETSVSERGRGRGFRGRGGSEERGGFRGRGRGGSEERGGFRGRGEQREERGGFRGRGTRGRGRGEERGRGTRGRGRGSTLASSSLIPSPLGSPVSSPKKSSEIPIEGDDD